MIRSALLAAALSIFLTVLLVPVVIRLCHRWQILDSPGPLKIHTKPVPRLGGVALVAAISISIFAVAPRLSAREWAFFAALALVFVTGMVDDLRSLPVLVRLAAQMAAAALLWHQGWTVPVTRNDAATFVATSIFVVAFIDSVNFLDGSDGLAAGVAAIIAGAYALAGIAFADSFMFFLASGVAAACVGFLVHNSAPAKIFLGDSGSTALGLCLAFLGLELWRSGHLTPARLFFPILVAALPLLDGALAILRRLAEGFSPLYGDRGHIGDQMLARGWSQRRVAFVCYGITAMLAAVALSGVRYEPQQFWLAPVLSAGALTAYAVKLGCLHGRREKLSPEEPGGGIGNSGKSSAGYG